MKMDDTFYYKGANLGGFTCGFGYRAIAQRDANSKWGLDVPPDRTARGRGDDPAVGD